jgi:hypothetical protein
MFIDDYGHEFETVEEIKDFAKKEFDNLDDGDLADIMESYFSTRKLLKWILKNDKEKFIKEEIVAFNFAKHGYVKDYFIIHDIEEM